jgi:hypothetical protein
VTPIPNMFTAPFGKVGACPVGFGFQPGVAPLGIEPFGPMGKVSPFGKPQISPMGKVSPFDKQQISPMGKLPDVDLWSKTPAAAPMGKVFPGVSPVGPFMTPAGKQAAMPSAKVAPQAMQPGFFGADPFDP